MRIRFASNVEVAPGQFVKAIRLTEGRKQSSVTVWVEDDGLEGPDQVGAHEGHATDLAIAAMREIAKRTGARFALPEVHQPTHYALPLAELGGKAWLDHSPGPPEIETQDLEVAKTWAALPELLKNLRESIQSIESTVTGLVQYAQDNNIAIEKLGQGLALVNDKLRGLEAYKGGEGPREGYG